ncbi:MAG: hypothetical protein ACRDZM_10365 [Acidimicrobiia bacterium]
MLLVAACTGGEGDGMPAGDHVHSLAVTADGGLLLGLHGGLYQSKDGERWELAGLSGEDAMVIATAASGDPLFVAGHDVLYRSDDGGETYSPLAPSDLPGLDIHAFAQSPVDPQTVYAYVVGHGLYASNDTGDTWEARASVESLPQDVFGLAAPGSDTETLVMVGPESGVLRSVDGGRTFAQVSDVPTGVVAVDKDTPDVVWALTATGLARSDDAGASWDIALTLDGVEGQPVALAVAGDQVWVVAEQPRALYHSVDGGESWAPVTDT